MNRFERQLSLRPRFALGLSGVIVVCGALAGFGVIAVCGLPARAQDRSASDGKGTDAKADGSSPSDTPPAGGLNESQASLERRYQQFERTLLQMAEYLRKTEPERADLLIRAIGRSKENRIPQQMEAITQLLKKEQFGDAIGDQQHLVGDLKGLLELLQSEDRRHQLEQDKQYYESLQKEVIKLAARERDLRQATERGGNLNRLAERQRDIHKDAQSLLDKIEKEDNKRNGADGKPNARKPNDGKKAPGDKNANGDKKSDGDKDSDSDKKSDKQSGAENKSDDDKKADGDKKTDADKKAGDNKQADASSQQKGDSKDGDKKEGKKSDAKGDQKSPSDKSKDPSKKDDKSPSKDDKQSDSQHQKKGDSKKQDSKSGKSQKGQPTPSGEEQSEQQEQQEGSQPQESEQQQDQAAPKKTPGRSEIEAARRAMQQAEEELKRLQGKKGMEHEDQAIRKLAEARAQLEKVLRQLREEEQQIILASLEARFAKMLVMQLQIHVDTIALSKTTKNAWTAKHFGRSRELSVEEDEIASEAAKALTLLKEEGSSVAFPQGVEQVRDDMLNIVRRLSGNDVGDFTQSVERDVIESLEEMVTALQNEIEKRQKEDEKRRQQPGQKSQGDAEKELVQQLAELKMLRSLQFRVNRRTKQIGHMIIGEEASNDNLLRELAKLARRQAEIQEATYIIATGRNR
jgi:hypothetical protein